MAGGERKAYPLRVDPTFWAAVERCAAADLRSVNSPGRMPAARGAQRPRHQARRAGPAQARAPAKGEMM